MRLIDADALLDEMGAGCLPIFEKGISDVTGDEDSIKDYVDRAPTIEAAPVVHARWAKEPYLFGWTYRCTRCHENYGMPHGEFSFCPNCGARMEVTRVSKYIHIEWRGTVTVRADLPFTDFMTEKEIANCRDKILNGAFEEELGEVLKDELDAADVDIKRESIHVSEVSDDNAAD